MVDQALEATRPTEVATQLIVTGHRSVPDDREIVQATLQRLRSRGYDGLKSITCEHHEGMVVLHGHVATYFLKQLAQEVANKIPGVKMIINSVIVDAGIR